METYTCIDFWFEILDFCRINENDLFKHDWRSRSKAQVFQYIFLKWTLACLVGLFTGLIATLINLAVENIAGYKLLAVGYYIAQDRYWLISQILKNKTVKIKKLRYLVWQVYVFEIGFGQVWWSLRGRIWVWLWWRQYLLFTLLLRRLVRGSLRLKLTLMALTLPICLVLPPWWLRFVS